GDSVSTVFFDASAGKLEFKRAAGALLALGSFSELLTIDAAPTTLSTNSLPGNAMVLAVSVYVAVTIPDASAFWITNEYTGGHYDSGGVTSTAGSSDPGNNGCPQPPVSTSAQRIVITPNATPSTNAGRVRIVAYWFLPTAPTS
ncbi:MAG: hypothetical protein HYY18_13290, partial [Planctomycetes bacterium]|nr:hypothetical protein [Planctomycetota bacterium]